MKFINHSGQSVYLGDIDYNITYLEDLSPQDISLDLVKKSKKLLDKWSFWVNSQ